MQARRRGAPPGPTRCGRPAKALGPPVARRRLPADMAGPRVSGGPALARAPLPPPPPGSGPTIWPTGRQCPLDSTGTEAGASRCQAATSPRLPRAAATSRRGPSVPATRLCTGTGSHGSLAQTRSSLAPAIAARPIQGRHQPPGQPPTWPSEALRAVSLGHPSQGARAVPARALKAPDSRC